MGVVFDAERIRSVLREAISRTAEIEGAALVSYDGIMIVNTLRKDSSEDMVAAMTATLLNLGKLSVEVLQRGSLEQVFLKSTNGYIVIGKAGEKNVITLLAKREAKIGILMSEITRAGDVIVKLQAELAKEKKKPT